MSEKHVNDHFEGATFFKKSVTALVLLTFLSLFYGYYSSLTVVSTYKSSDNSEDNQNYWNDWRIVIIIYYLSIGIITFVGFFGIIFDKFYMIFIYSIFLIFFWIFGFVNEALRKNAFGLTVELPTAIVALAYARSIRLEARNQLRSRPKTIWTTQTSQQNVII